MEPDMSNGMIIVYQLEYRISNSNTTFMTVNSSALMYTVTGLLSSTGYQVRVAAFTRVGQGPYSMLVQALTTGKFSPYIIIIMCINFSTDFYSLSQFILPTI